MLTSASLPSKMQNIASQHSGLLAERARERQREREGERERGWGDGKTDREREECGFSLLSYSAEPGWAMVSSINHHAYPGSVRGGSTAVVSPPVASTESHTHAYILRSTLRALKRAVSERHIDEFLYRLSLCGSVNGSTGRFMPFP